MKTILVMQYNKDIQINTHIYTSKLCKMNEKKISSCLFSFFKEEPTLNQSERSIEGRRWRLKVAP